MFELSQARGTFPSIPWRNIAPRNRQLVLFRTALSQVRTC